MSDLAARLDSFLARLEQWLPPQLTDADWEQAVAFRWRKRQSLFGNIGYLQAIRQLPPIHLDDLKNIERQKDAIVANTRQFVQHLPANNVLLTGARGTGKSSLIKACLNAFVKDGLRLVEVDKDDLGDLGDIVEQLSGRPERFAIFCDDLSFEEGESGYKSLKSALDGSVAAQSDNVLIYATSNRRHLLPEYMKDNETYRHTDDGEIHPGEVVEEKISLSERFGLWLSFYPPKQDEYLTIVGHWLGHFGCSTEDIAAARGDALVWALERGSRSGRVAWQFARDWGGKLEPGESVEQALARELHEELGIEVGASVRWHVLEHDYPHAYVRLHFCKVTAWTGELVGREGQAFSWQSAPVDVGPLLPATIPVVDWLAAESGAA